MCQNQLPETSGEKMRAIGDEEWDNPKPLSEEDMAIHQQNVMNVRKLVMSFAIAKIGLLTLAAVIMWKFFGNGRH